MMNRINFIILQYCIQLWSNQTQLCLIRDCYFDSLSSSYQDMKFSRHQLQSQCQYGVQQQILIQIMLFGVNGQVQVECVKMEILMNILLVDVIFIVQELIIEVVVNLIQDNGQYVRAKCYQQLLDLQ
ncbi:unnamed protein product [Paramecium sonneborni]|uniref:Uncharacterized protein n=1 Tax=Paramecium sonneborni TaxID=65129 RepID=A0A8S1RCR7_9CILI|nr:unnamed protein product [Paramecium sonneborni]